MEISPQMLLRILACVCIALAIACAVLALMLYRREDIRGVMADLSGKSRQNSAEGMLRSRQSLRQLAQMRSMEEGILRKEASRVKPGTTAEVSSGGGASMESVEIAGSHSGSRGSASSEARRMVAFERNDSSVGANSANGDFTVTKGLLFTAAQTVIDIK